MYKSICAVDDTYRIQYSRKPITDQYGQMNRGSFQPNKAPKLVWNNGTVKELTNVASNLAIHETYTSMKLKRNLKNNNLKVIEQWVQS